MDSETAQPVRLPMEVASELLVSSQDVQCLLGLVSGRLFIRDEISSSIRPEELSTVQELLAPCFANNSESWLQQEPSKPASTKVAPIFLSSTPAETSPELAAEQGGEA